MKNTDLRARAKEKGVFLWQIAAALGIPDTGLSKRLRNELSADEKNRIYVIIEELSTGGC